MSHQVLIIDDDEDFRRAISIRLRSKGYRTTFAGDAIGAMTAIRRDPPDVVLLDLMLPGGNGYEMLERFRNLAHLGSLPVLVISASDAGQHERRAIEAGACGFLQKPVRTDELMAAIERCLPHNDATEPAAAAEGPHAKTGGGPSPSRVLVVDDDPDLRNALFIRLRANGYQTHFASDAVSAVQVARQHVPDVILLDLGLPAGDGFLVMERLRNIEALACIPVIVMTAREPATVRDRALRAGAVAFLPKPIDNGALLESIRSALGPEA